MTTRASQPDETPVKKITIRIFADDANFLKVAYPRIGYNKVIRQLVRNHVRGLQAKTVEKLDTSKLSPAELRTV